ncbi:MAG: hypothetical protein KAX64_05320 [Chromatiaceae bacterium]|nr:hypothetical protein [Chromatiaceae bacterium]MBP8283439.1 hypothetical protein [Chromatiaceae bacterium]
MTFAELLDALAPRGTPTHHPGSPGPQVGRRRTGAGTPIPELDTFLKAELARQGADFDRPPPPGITVERLDALLWDWVMTRPSVIGR